MLGPLNDLPPKANNQVPRKLSLELSLGILWLFWPTPCGFGEESITLNNTLPLKLGPLFTGAESFLATVCQPFQHCGQLRVVFKHKLATHKLAGTSCPETQGTSDCRGISVIKCESVLAVLPESVGKNGWQPQAERVSVIRREAPRISPKDPGI